MVSVELVVVYVVDMVISPFREPRGARVGGVKLSFRFVLGFALAALGALARVTASAAVFRVQELQKLREPPKCLKCLF